MILHSISIFSHNAVLWFAGIFGIGFLIGLHEFGHFLFCKIFHVKTPSFSIGLGPRLIEKKIGDTVFTLSAIPFGGYVEIAGAAEVGQGDQKEAKVRDKYSFAIKPYWQKMLIMAGGIIFNTIFAYFTFIMLCALGVPKTPLFYPLNAKGVIEQIVPGSPASAHDFQPGDKIISVDNKPLESISNLLKKIRSSPGQPIAFSISRNEIQKTINLNIGTQPSNNKIGTVGIIFEIDQLKPSNTFIDAIKNGIETTNLGIAQIFYTLKNIIHRKGMETVGGPLMIIAESIKGARKGAKIFFALLAFISINLAILNIIPLPITDGGQALFYTIEAIIRRELPEKTKLLIHYVCWVGIIILFVYLSIKDVWRLIQGWL